MHKKYNFKLELGIVIFISLCMMFLVSFINRKFNEIIFSKEAEIIVANEENEELNKKLANEMLKFRPGTYKMIELYSEDYESLFRIQFMEETEPINTSLSDQKGLIEIFENYEEGNTKISVNDTEEDIYFAWMNMSNGERNLLIIYTNAPVVKNIWVCSFICYIVIISVFILFILLLLKQNNERIEMLSNYVDDI